MKKFAIITTILILLTGCNSQQESQPTTTNTPETPKLASNTDINLDEYEPSPMSSQEAPLPNNVLLEVPFTSQAPHANWDDPYQEACEEASIIMAYDYTQGINSYTKAEADTKILDLIQYQQQNGYTQDITVSELQTISKDFYQIETEVLEGELINTENFKRILSTDTPIVIPASGRTLGNPNFSGAGPAYHMLVIIGYDDDKQVFITNDPGTRNGAKYEYSYETIMSSIHDWNGSKYNIQQGTPRALIIKA